MQSTEATNLLVRGFDLDGVLADTAGHLVHSFTGDFEFASTELDAATIRLSAQLDGLPVGHRGIARRLLEASLTGVETGSGAMAPDPVGSGLYALVDTVAISDLTVDAFRQRFTDFMLYAEYWRSEGVASLQARMRDATRAGGASTEAIMVRA